MGRFQRYGKSDTPWATDGDPGFVGVDMLHDRGQLGPGYLARSENKRLRDGAAATRPGTTFAGDFNPVFDNKIIGSHIYSNPNGDQVMLVATAGATYVYALQFGKDPVKINLAIGNTGFGIVNFVQAFDKVLMMRFPFSAGSVLVWDGNNANTFGTITLSTNGLKLIPQTISGVPFQNRVLLFSPYNASLPWRDQIVMTDVLDYTSYDDVFGLFRINAGQSNIITSVFPYFKGAVVVFMYSSTHMLQDFTVDPTLTSQRMLNNRIGAVGINGPLQVGEDVIFLSRQGGFYRLSQIVQDEITTPPIPISRKIQPIIDRIDLDRAVLYHSSASLDDWEFYAVPLDQKNGACDAILVRNSVSQEWESAPDWWDDANFRINRLHVTSYNGQQRLFALDYAASRIYLLYDGLEDEISGNSVPVRDVIETRGYTGGDPSGFKRFMRANIGVRTYDPQATVTALSDGVNEEKLVKTITKDRKRFYVHGHKEFDVLTDDATEPKRQDYSTQDEGVAIEDFEDLPDGVLLSIPPTPLVFTGVKQQSLERFPVRQNGRWCSLRIENTNGQCDVLGVAVDAIPSMERTAAVA
jgi:hypothetical protein